MVPRCSSAPSLIDRLHVSKDVLSQRGKWDPDSKSRKDVRPFSFHARVLLPHGKCRQLSVWGICPWGRSEDMYKVVCHGDMLAYPTSVHNLAFHPAFHLRSGQAGGSAPRGNASVSIRVPLYCDQLDESSRSEIADGEASRQDLRSDRRRPLMIKKKRQEACRNGVTKRPHRRAAHPPLGVPGSARSHLIPTPCLADAPSTPRISSALCLGRSEPEQRCLTHPILTAQLRPMSQLPLYAPAATSTLTPATMDMGDDGSMGASCKSGPSESPE